MPDRFENHSNEGKAKENKNALSSVESRVLGVKQPGLLYYFLRFGIQNECCMS